MDRLLQPCKPAHMQAHVCTLYQRKMNTGKATGDTFCGRKDFKEAGYP